MKKNTIWNLIVVGYFSLFVFGFLDNTRGPYFPDLTDDLSLTDTEASLFFAVASFVAVLSGRLVPWLIDKIRLINMMRLGLLLLAVSCFGYSQSQSLTQLIVSTSLFGFGFGLINVGQNLLIIRGSGETNQRQLISGLHSTYAFASLMAPLVVGFLTDIGWDWRQGFQSFAFLGLLGFFVSFIVKSEPKNELADRELSIFGWKKWLPIGTVLSLYVASEVVLSSRFVLLNRRAFDATEAEAALRLAGFFALLFLGRLAFTFFSFRRWSNRQVILVTLVLSTATYILGLSISHWFLILCGFFMAPFFGVTVDYMANGFGRDADRVISMVLAFSGLFIVAIHWGVGFLTDIFGIHKAMYSAPLLLSLAILIMVFLEPEGEKSV